MRINLDHVASGRFVLERGVHCEFDYWPLAVSMPPTKVCSQCKAVVPVRWKTCERYDHAKDKLHKACERASEICEQALWNKTMRMASMRESRGSD